MSQPSGSLRFDDSATLLEIWPRLDEEISDSQRGKMVLEVDLNDPPVPPEYGITYGITQVAQAQPSKDFEVIDDDVVIISSRIFDEAKNNSTRNPEVRPVTGTEMIEVNFHHADASTSYPINRTKRRRVLRNQAVLNWELYMNSEDDSKDEANDERVVQLSEAAPSFNCPICMGPMSEETSTKCGHIFCKKCIEAAIKVQHKCPTCRHKLRIKDVIRIYLPTSG